jgi:hypothetical protein
MNPSETTFFWVKPSGQSSRLFTSLGVSLLVHLLVFQLFLVLGPEHANSPAPAPELTFLSREIPEHRALLESIQAQFPTAALSHPKLSSERWLQPEFRASYRWPQTAPILPALPNPAAHFPTIAPPLPLQETSITSPQARVLLSGALKNRSPKSPNPPVAPAPASTSLESPRFWIAVRPSGEVAHVFLDSPGVPSESSRSTETFLRQLRFDPNHTAPELEWGQAVLQPANPPSQ